VTPERILSEYNKDLIFFDSKFNTKNSNADFIISRNADANGIILSTLKNYFSLRIYHFSKYFQN